MKLQKKKLLLLALAVCLAVSMIPTVAFAGMDEEKEVVALVGNKEYTDFQEAINDVKDGQTITLTDDVLGGGFDTEGKDGIKFTIDLNDYKITNQTGWWNTLMISEGDVTIKNGAIENLSDDEAKKDEDGDWCFDDALYVESKATLKNVKLFANGPGAATLVAAAGSKLIMTGCIVETVGSDQEEDMYAEALYVGKNAYVKATKCEFYSRNAERAAETFSKTLLTNCKLQAKECSILAFEGADLRISKGSYKGCVYTEINAKTTINGGYFKDQVTALTVFGNVIIKDGKFYGEDNAVYVSSGKVTVHKGYFSAASGKAWGSKKNSKQLDKTFKIAKGSKVVQKNWKTGRMGTIKVKTK